MIKLKNYTSGVPAERSIMAVEKLLVEAGASHISKTYFRNELEGITFQIPVKVYANPLQFKLPVRVDACYQLLMTEVKRPRKGFEKKMRDQATRTAWKILHDWTAVQVSMIMLGQAEAIEVFLPYAYDPRTEQTFFEKLKEGEYKQLGPAIK